MDTRSIVDALRGFFESLPDGIVCAWLFGSVARGTARPDSDADVAVLLERDPPQTLEGSAVAMAGDIEAAIGRPVDLVVLNRAPVDLIHRVLRDGVLLVERDRNARVRFEVRARNEFFDLKPHLDRYRRAGERAHGRP
ncbi:MAG: nucleotidyltransferase domain-containing protein [Burkholderiaceae bacterium]|nr:nucleotidyltransferase domain-containing protein [Burkholderiaceae bacterium]